MRSDNLCYCDKPIRCNKPSTLTNKKNLIMETYDLKRLTAGSFERLIRALCFELMGPAGTVYSSGPDGGRDYTYEGDIPGYEAQGWNGYLVLQAKFREKPQGSAADAKWLKKQLSSELKKFKSSKGNPKRPCYYIIATNVSLSGTDGNGPTGKRVGGHTVVSNELETWKSKIGLKGFDIWSGDKIIDLLTGAPGVRQTYAAWITSGDVLNAALKAFKASETPNFDEVLSRSLKNSLRRDQMARLKDGGSVTDGQIRISQVFIDLPVYIPDFEGELTLGSDASEPMYSRVVGLLVNRSKEKLDPSSISCTTGTAPSDTNRKLNNKIVLLGGPGQGKSTASMFAAQLFRAAMLEKDVRTNQDGNVRTLVPEILRRAEKEGITRDVPRRYPVFVSLPRFADAISLAKAKNLPPPSLLTQIALDLSAASDMPVDRRDVRNWLKHYPWIVIFDGLDEVPPSGERVSVIDAISVFVTETVDVHADVLIVVTTRPQGYNDDLDSNQWEQWLLSDLDTERANAYAVALGDARYPDDPVRRSDILTSLREASHKPATSRLMISPLQVTIMHMIVDTGGGVPAARWALFNDYFEILKKRERAKGGENQKILERNGSLLGPIHQRAGLVLQTDSEHAGGAGAALDERRFKQMVHELLRADGHSEADISARSDELLVLAVNRLVLLSAHVEGKITFDVRSLQEFMAAAAMTSGDQRTIEKRLTHIAGMSHWRHVFLIAASRCFAEDGFHHLRSTVVGIPRALDTSLPDLATRNGALLSLDMFVDGIGVDHPTSRKLLAQHALTALELGPQAFDVRITQLYEDQTRDLVERAIRERINEGATRAGLASWKLLCALSRKYPAIFLPIAEQFWPSDHVHALEILSAIQLPLPSGALIEKARQSIMANQPSSVRKKLANFSRHTFRSAAQDSPLNDHSEIFKLLAWQAENPRDGYALLNTDSNGPLSAVLQSIEDTKRFDAFRHPLGFSMHWTPFIVCAKFLEKPSPETLSNALVRIAETNTLSEAKQFATLFPWPIAAFIAYANDNDSLLNYSKKVQSGDFGDQKIWRAAEVRWTEHGITEGDILHAAGNLPFCSEIHHIGYPAFCGYRMKSVDKRIPSVFLELVEIVNKLERGLLFKRLMDVLQFATYGIREEQRFSKKSNSLLFIKLLSEHESDSVHPDVLDAFDESVWEDDEIVDVFNKLAPISRRSSVVRFTLSVATVVSAYNRNPSRRGLIFVIALCMAYGKNTDLSELKKIHFSAYEPSPADKPIVQVAAMLLRIAIDKSVEPNDLATSIMQSSKADIGTKHTVGALNISLVFLRGGLCPWEKKIDFLMAIIEHVEQNETSSADFQELLKKILDGRQSSLTESSVWNDRLQLPSDAYKVLQPIAAGTRRWSPLPLDDIPF